MSESTTNWYIIKTATGTCEILPPGEIPAETSKSDTWGPFPTKSDAIAKRVGLIRAGKCQPL
jgi:hypothetical protein